MDLQSHHITTFAYWFLDVSATATDFLEILGTNRAAFGVYTDLS